MSPAPRRPQQQTLQGAAPGATVEGRAPRAPNALMVMSNFIAAKEESLAQVQTKYIDAKRIVKLGQLAVSRVPDLAKCTQLSVLDALMECSRLGLEPHVPGGIWMIPFKDNRSQTLVCTKVIDYRGMIDVARRSGAVAAVHADLVGARDLWEYWVDASSPVLIHLRHKTAPGELGDPAGRGAILGAYALVKLGNGQVQAQFLTLPEINAYKNRSKTKDSSFSPWKSDENAMRLKTVLRRLYNLLPKNPEIQKLREALASEVDDIDNPTGEHIASKRRVRAILEESRENGTDAVTADDAAGAVEAALGGGEQGEPGDEPPPDAGGEPLDDVPGYGGSQP